MGNPNISQAISRTILKKPPASKAKAKGKAKQAQAPRRRKATEKEPENEDEDEVVEDEALEPSKRCRTKTAPKAAAKLPPKVAKNRFFGDLLATGAKVLTFWIQREV